MFTKLICLLGSAATTVLVAQDTAVPDPKWYEVAGLLVGLAVLGKCGFSGDIKRHK